jgi:hypothetical protein
MRSSYNAIDELDCYPMDEFQRSFFLFRQSEWETYKAYHPTVMQGNLNDPQYFDFISFAQYAVISNCFKNGKSQFIEKSGAEGTSTVIRRNSSIVSSNDMLPDLHSKMVGATIFNYIVSTYPTIIPKQIGSNLDPLTWVSNAQLLLDIFAINLFALSLKIDTIQEFITENGQKACIATITSILPANVWSIQVLKRREDRPLNNFETKVLSAYAEVSGIELDLISVEVKDQVNVIQTIRLTQI